MVRPRSQGRSEADDDMRQAGILPDSGYRRCSRPGALAAPRRSMTTRSSRRASTCGSGETAYRVRASFLPGPAHGRRQARRLKLHEIDLTEGAVLETGCVYIVPLLESLALPADVSASANPKSSTGRLDIFTRVMTDHGARVRQDPGRLSAARSISKSARAPSRSWCAPARACRRSASARGDAAARRGRARRRCMTPRRWSPPRRPIISGGGIALSIDLSGDEERPRRLSRQAPHRPSSMSTGAARYDVLDFWEPIRRPRQPAN